MGDVLQKPNSLPHAAPGSGHRARLLERYLKAGMTSLSDYEILELILTFALPRRDTKPLAKRLIATYGTVSAVLNAPLDELCEIDGLGKRSAAILTLIKDTILFCQNETSVKKPIITQRGDIEKHLRFKFGHSREEYAAAIFLDNGNNVIGTEIIAHGTVNRCVIYPRKIMERAIKCGAAAFIFAHNHPAGSVQPSESDWETTERLRKTGEVMDVRLIDHIIISRDSVVSLREYDRWSL
ncbi:MAG: DNA repair protein RadC [Chitinispirillales bacterium]|jgi:DNA repair protein RadC|nr:DNA repair protein RadC [Chitinispirillales bacterium]